MEKFLQLFHKDDYKIYGTDLNSPIIEKLKINLKYSTTMKF